MKSRIRGHFHGFKIDSLFQLADGSTWLQTQDTLWRFHAYEPEVHLLTDAQGQHFLQLPDQDIKASVVQVTDVIYSRIKDEFHGWEGETTYQLTNDQVWQQVDFSCHYQYAYMPHVVVYSCDGCCFMQVVGETMKVRRVQ